MKRIVPAVVIVSLVISSCFIFKKKEKYGCPSDARNMTEQEINARANKTKYRGGNKY
jgi:hypothetical protein